MMSNAFITNEQSPFIATFYILFSHPRDSVQNLSAAHRQLEQPVETPTARSKLFNICVVKQHIRCY